jgi:hypothetical protein
MKPEGWGKEDLGLTAWQALHTRVVNYNGVKRRGRQELVQQAVQDVHYHLQRVRLLPRHLPSEELVLNSIAAIGGGVWTAESGDALQRRLRAVVDQLRRHQLRSGRRSFQAWIQESLKKGAVALHKMTTSWGQPLQELSCEAQADGEVLTDPLEVISSKSQRWATLWQCTDEPVQADWWENLWAAARQ